MFRSALVCNVHMDNTGEEEGGIKSRGIWSWRERERVFRNFREDRPIYISIPFASIGGLEPGL